MKILLLISIIASMASSCQDNIQESDIIKIEYGTSFGSCLGYCIKQVTFTQEEVVKVLKPSRSTDLKEKTCRLNWTDWPEVIKKVDFDSFMKLEETIGCPDCADGGAEWVEITTSDGPRKVTFEYGKAPNGVKGYISELRKYFDKMGDCE